LRTEEGGWGLKKREGGDEMEGPAALWSNFVQLEGQNNNM